MITATTNASAAITTAAIAITRIPMTTTTTTFSLCLSSARCPTRINSGFDWGQFSAV